MLGFTDGELLGDELGPELGEVLGASLGPTLGIVLGAELGSELGLKLGKVEGKVLGFVLGKIEGKVLGFVLGKVEGKVLGSIEVLGAEVTTIHASGRASTWHQGPSTGSTNLSVQSVPVNIDFILTEAGVLSAHVERH